MIFIVKIEGMFTKEYEASRERLMKAVFTGNAGKYNKQARNADWFGKKGYKQEYEDLMQLTSYLDTHNPSIRERVYYVEKYLQETQLCMYCNKEKLRYRIAPSGLRSRCEQTACKSKSVSENSLDFWNNCSEEQKAEIGAKISEKTKGKKLSEEHVQFLRDINTGVKQSQETKERRYTTRKNNGQPWHTEATKEKISKTNSITHSSEEFQKKHKQVREEASRKASRTMVDKVHRGLFTPCITNSWTKWKAYIETDSGDIVKFRSSWEAVFHELTPGLQYETVRIPYTFEGRVRNYIVDFEDKVNKVVYEIKPDSTKDSNKVKAKQAAAIEWASCNGYRYKMISNEWFSNNAYRIDYNRHKQLLKPMKQFLKGTKWLN